MSESFERNGVVADPERRLTFRIVREGIVVVKLADGEALLAEPRRLLYRRGPVRWSLAPGGRNLMGRLWNQAMRQAAGVGGQMHKYEGPGEIALSAAAYGRLSSVHLEPGDNLVVERRCLVAVTPGVGVDVAFSRALGRRGAGGRVMLMRLTGSGTAFLQAHGISTELQLEEGEEVEARATAVVCFEATVEYELRIPASQRLGRPKKELEWMAALTGPGRVLLQTAGPMR